MYEPTLCCSYCIWRSSSLSETHCFRRRRSAFGKICNKDTGTVDLLQESNLSIAIMHTQYNEVLRQEVSYLKRKVIKNRSHSSVGKSREVFVWEAAHHVHLQPGEDVHQAVLGHSVHDALAVPQHGLKLSVSPTVGRAEAQ